MLSTAEMKLKVSNKSLKSYVSNVLIYYFIHNALLDFSSAVRMRIADVYNERAIYVCYVSNVNSYSY